jgi:hypothetical protein
MQMLQMPNMITLSYLRHDRHILSWRDLHNTHEDNHLAGAKSHPSCKINPSQARLFEFMGFGKATFKTKHYKYFKTAGSRVKGKQQTQPRNILPVRSSLDDEFRSSRNIAIGLHRRYRNVVERGCGEKLREFIKAGVTAYAVGCTDEGLRKELISLKASEVEAEGMPGSGSSTRLRAKITSEEIEECILWLSIIFITILCTPQPTIVRWSNTPPVSAETRLQWNGFCALIANAYYTRGMAWLPVKTLQLEQMAVTGIAEEPAVVAGWMRLVFATLEVVSPQWPRV